MPLFPFLSFHATRTDVLSILCTVTIGRPGAERKSDTYMLEIFVTKSSNARAINEKNSNIY